MPEIQLIDALKSGNPDIRQAVVGILCGLGTRRAAQALAEVVQNRLETQEIRINAIQGLWGGEGDETITAIVRRIVFDEDEDLCIRREIIEFSCNFLETSDLLKLLEHPIPDIRFWTAYAFSFLTAYPRDNFFLAFDTLDKIAAFDQSIPEFWGWHVGREALAPLENIFYQPYRQFFIDEAGQQDEHPWGMMLISPAPEYMRYNQNYRELQPDGRYLIKEVQFDGLSVDVEWLKSTLQAAWEGIAFDVRPESQTYALSWILQIDDYNLLGGLHRDNYAVVLTGNRHPIYAFARWYRDIMTHPTLYLYEWAAMGIVLHQNMTPKQITKALNRQYSAFKYIPP